MCVGEGEGRDVLRSLLAFKYLSSLEVPKLNIGELVSKMLLHVLSRTARRSKVAEPSSLFIQMHVQVPHPRFPPHSFVLSFFNHS